MVVSVSKEGYEGRRQGGGGGWGRGVLGGEDCNVGSTGGGGGAKGEG
jgi:hypothetical protein